MNRHGLYNRGPNQFVQLRVERYTAEPHIGAPRILSFTINRTRATRQNSDDWYIQQLVGQIIHDTRHYYAQTTHRQATRAINLNRMISGMFIIQERDSTNSTMEPFNNLNEITTQLIYNKFQSMSQSGRNNPVVFQFEYKVFIRPESYNIGAGAKNICKKWFEKAPKCAKTSYQEQVYYERIVNCAAYALELGFNYVKKQ